MVYKLSDTFRTGIPALDEDHHNLVVLVNEISEAERQGDVGTLVQRLTTFRAHLAEHFTGEDHHLRALSYPKLGAHVRHHAEILVAVERLIRDVQDGVASTCEIAATCFHELISVVLLRDMDFVNWFQDQKNLR